MRNFISLIIILFFFYSISFAQTPCSDITNIAAEVDIEAPGFEIDVANLEFSGGTCGTINYNGQEINGSSTLNFNVNIALGADELLCGTIDGNPPGIMDVINVDPSYSCEFNIMNVTGAMNAYLVTFDDNIPIEKIVKGTVNRTDLIQVYSPVATTIELPISVSATLVAIQTFCDPAESVAEAKADLTASLAGVSVNLIGVARVEGGFLDNQYPSVSQVISVPIPAGLSTFNMNLMGELSVRSRVLGLASVIACGSNAVASADNSIDVGNFTGPHGGPFPEGMTIIGLDSGIDYVNPMEPLSCLNIPAPDIVVQDDNCAAGTGSATVTSIDTLTYEWSNGATGAQASDLSYGTYFLTVSDAVGCSRDFYVFVDDPQAPELTLPNLLTIEENESVTLIPTDTSNTTLTYLWSTGETTPVIEVSNEGAYSVTISTATGCEYEAETLVQESTPIDFSPCMSANYLFSGNADDISGNNNHATVFGATLIEDRNGRAESAYYFDGVDDYIEFPTVAETQPESGLTFTAWFKSDSLSSDDWGTIVKNTEQGYEVALNKIKTGGISSNLDLQSGSNLNLNSRLNEYADNQWHSLAITYDGNSGIYRLFIDGNLNNESLGSMDAIAYQTGTPFTTGRNGITNSNYFKGTIDDVKIFNCPLNEDELSYLFSQQQNFDCYTEIYFEDFEGDIGSEWSSLITYQIDEVVDTTKILGRFNSNSVLLTLQGIPINSLVTLCFDFWAFDSWDGNGPQYGLDFFRVRLSPDRNLLYTTVRNSISSQTYPSDYSSDYITNNLGSTGSELLGQYNNDGNNRFDSKYEICRTFFNTEDTIEVSFRAFLTEPSLNDESWGIDNVSILIPPSILNTSEETVTCNSDGSYIVSIPFTSNGDNTNYMAYEQANTFGDIDTLFFTDDGTISNIEMPYPSGRDYNIVIAPAGDMSDCYPVISGTTECTFTEPCNLNATFTDECVGDSLVITGTITGGVSPYSVYSDEYNTVLFPDDGDTFTFTIPSCFPQLIDFTITDFNMCQYTENLTVDTEFPTNESSCLESITLHPNPVTSALHISFSEICNHSNVKIYDSLGQLIRSDILTDSSASYDVSTLPKGVYFLHIDNEEDGHVEKFIKI